MTPHANPYQVLFLLGAIRSGTVFLRNVLGANPNILALPGELSETWTTVGQAPCGVVPSCPMLDASDLNENTAIAMRAVFDHLFGQRNSIQQIGYRFYRGVRYGNETLIKKGTPFIVLNKSNHLLNKLGYVDPIFPTARYILIVRDIFSHTNSVLKHFATVHSPQSHLITNPANFAECWSFAPANGTLAQRSYSTADVARYWIEQNSVALRWLEEHMAGRVLVIRFEDLTSELDRVLQRIRVFLQMNAINHRVSTRLVNNYSKDPLHEWRSSMSSEDTAAIRQTMAKFQSEYDYVADRVEVLGNG